MHAWDFVNKLVEELRDLELDDSWIRVNALHKNFYEGRLFPELAKKYMDDAQKLVKKLCMHAKIKQNHLFPFFERMIKCLPKSVCVR